MRTIENECVCCDLPCIDCGRKHVEVVRCDRCEIDLRGAFSGLDGVEIDGEELCYSCAKELLIEKYYYSAKRKRDFYRYGGVDDEEFLAELDEMTNDQLKEVMMQEDFEVIAEDCKAEWKEIGW